MSKLSAKLGDSLKDNAERLKDNAADLKAKAGERVASAKDSARELAGTAKEKSSELVATGREKVSHGVDVTREKAREVGVKSKETIETHPLAVVAGGLVLGAVVAALLPTSERETKTIGGAGGKLKDKIASATAAAKETGAAKMKDAGISGDALRSQVSDLIAKGLDIARDAAKSATDAASRK